MIIKAEILRSKLRLVSLSNLLFILSVWLVERALKKKCMVPKMVPHPKFPTIAKNREGGQAS